MNTPQTHAELVRELKPRLAELRHAVWAVSGLLSALHQKHGSLAPVQQSLGGVDWYTCLSAMESNRVLARKGIVHVPTDSEIEIGGAA